MRNRIGVLAVSVSLAAAWLAGCDTTTEGCENTADCPYGTVCGQDGVCVLAGADDVAGDVGEPDGFSPQDGITGDAGEVVEPSDTADADAAGPDAAPDADPADTTDPDSDADGPADVPPPFDIGPIDTTPPKIVSIDPAHDESGVGIPVTVTIEFNEAIRPETVDKATVRVVHAQTGKVVSEPPTLSEDGTIVSLELLAKNLALASPYRVEIQAILQDKQGNKLGQDTESTFYTHTADVAAYAELAATYAPIARQATDDVLTQLDYPTRFDLDDNDVGEDNPAFIQSKAKTVPAAVHWDVSETQSHLFLVYTYFYPLRDLGSPGTTRVANDTAGVMIVLRKDAGALVPVSALTYSAKGDAQNIFAFAVSGEELDGAPLVDKTATSEALFEDGRFQLLLTAGSHQACAWNVSGPGDCDIAPGDKAILELVEYRYAEGSDGPIAKNGTTWPRAIEAQDFALLHTMDAWWTRRHLTGSDAMWGSTFDYQPEPTRPGSSLKAQPAIFAATLEFDFGRPPWSWKWDPSGFGSFTKLPQGNFFFDPAWFVKKRHTIAAEWDPATKTGFSTDYCFQPYLGIDNRGSSEDCPAAL